ncbi:glycosyltransferase family 31 protein [Hydnomerulius pinastri MD-312]|nr:glycosyltransferase family 31 protein [Hydnomerulius pinastri MD-312]
MAGLLNFLGSSKTSQSSAGEEYEFLAGSDQEEVFGDTPYTMPVRERVTIADRSYPDTTRGNRSSSESSSSSATPTPSRVPSPSPSFPSHRLSSSASDADGEPGSPLLGLGAYTSYRDGSRGWWNLSPTSRRRRKRDARLWRTMKKGARRVVRHPLFPQQPLSIIFALLLLTVFAISLTLLLMYILNPDKEALPWQAYCSIPPTTSLPPSYHAPIPYPYVNPLPADFPPAFPPEDLDSIPPAGVFLGVFSMYSELERRMLIRTTWAAHPRSRNGAGAGDNGLGTSRTVVRFILGTPKKGWERRIQTEMEMYNDIVILPCPENMNSGKSHAYFTWAAENAWVPPIYFNTSTPVPDFSYSDQTAPAPRPAPHDSHLAWEDHASGHPRPWVRPDYVAKVDEDAFVMLAELESRMRLELHAKGQSPYGTPDTTPHIRDDSPESEASLTSTSNAVSVATRAPSQSQDPLVYWGYLVKNRFMAGELYGLSWSLVDWVSKDPTVKGLIKGAEDKQTAKWMALHPRASEIRWASDRCWIYDHPRSGTVYSHGFLFPSHVTRIKQSVLSYIENASRNHSTTVTASQSSFNAPNIPTPSSWAHSSVSTFGVRYQQPLQDMPLMESVEALVEGSDMSKIREDISSETEHAWRHREGRIKRYENRRVGGTVVVHFIKKHMWFLETAMAFLEADDYSEAELEGFPGDAIKERLNIGLSAVWTDTTAFKHANASSPS